MIVDLFAGPGGWDEALRSAKELSLAGVQRPISAATLTQHGAVEWFRFGDFAGYLIEGAAA